MLSRNNLSVFVKHFCFAMKHSGFVAGQNLFKKIPYFEYLFFR
jgi:hypothetical protein